MCMAYVAADEDGDFLRPEAKLAQMMATEMQISPINHTTLRLFLLVHWKEVARLAHKIHASGPSDGPTPKPVESGEVT